MVEELSLRLCFDCCPNKRIEVRSCADIRHIVLAVPERRDFYKSNLILKTRKVKQVQAFLMENFPFSLCLSVL